MKKVRKWLCVVLSVFFVFFGIPVTPGQLVFTMPELTANAVNVGDKITVDNVTYEIMQNSSGIKYAAVKSFNGDGWTTKINIQSEVSGLPVRTIEKLGQFELISITGLLSGTSVQELFIPDSVQIIRRYSFVFSATLVNAYLGQVRSIGDHAFSECILLQDVDIPNRECEIADTAFYGCNNVIIHGYSGSTAETFAKEHGLKFVAYFDPLETTQPAISTTQTTRVTTKPSVSTTQTTSYTTATPVTTAETIVTSVSQSGTCGDNLTWFFDGKYNSLTIFGTGDMTDWSSSNSVPWYDIRPKVQSIMIQDGVTTIGNYAFSGCSSLATITLMDTVTKIGNNAFASCTELRNIFMSKSVQRIGSMAFAGCSNLKSIEIPKGVTSIDESIFSGCNNLTEIRGSFNSAAQYYAEQHNFTFTVPERETQPVVSTAQATSYTTVISVTTVETTTTFEPKKGTCGDNLTWTLDSEGTLTIKGADDMSDWDDFINSPWYSCKEKIKKVVISNGVTSIGEMAFSGCKNLTSVTIPDSVTSIGEMAFSGCKNLTSVTIPDSVTSIGKRAFSYCDSLTSVIIPDSVTIIENSAFSGCKNLTSVTIPDSVIRIGDSAFDNCYSLTSVTIPDSVTSIGEMAFYNCKSLTSVTIPDSVTSIGKRAFYNCKSLTSVTIPDSVKEIANDAFFGCENLSTIYGDPYSTAQTYAEKNNITFVTTMPQGTCGENLTWTLSNDGTLVISGTGNMTMIRVFYDTPWYRYRENIKKVIIEDGVTSVGNDAFYECTNLASVNIPDSITIIGSGAFSDCTSLTSVNIPDSVTIIEDYAFQHTSLTSVTIPRSVEEIGRDAFWISTLTSITIKNPRCEIYAGGITISDGVIYGYPDSTAKSYASNYRIEFIALDGEPEETTTTATSTAKQETTTMTIITETTPAYSESIVLSIRPEKTSYTVAANNNVIYLQKESLPDTLHLGVYIDKYDSSCSNLNLKLCSDTDKITFIKDTFCNPSSYRYDVAKIYTLSNGTIFSTRFQPYALGRINSAGNYEPGCVFDKADFDSTGKEMTFCWTYDYSDYDASGNKLMNAPLLTDIPDELSFIEFDVKLDQTIAPGSYQLYFYTDETYNDSTYVTLDESVPDEEIPGLYKSIYKRFPPAVRNLSIVVLPEETAPETTSVTTTFTTTTTTTATTTAITTSASATTASTTSESVATTNETTTETKLSLLLKESKVILKAGQQYQIEANQDNLTYSSSNPEIAVVSSSGMVTALKKGEAVISVINQEYDVTQITLTVTSDTSESQAELGDLTQDEKVDASDAAMILVAAANQGSGQDSGLTEIQKTAADVNHDGKIDASDAAYILQYAAAKGAGAFAGTLSEYMSSIL